MAILLSGALLCGIGTGCTGSNTTESAKADYIWSNVAIGGGGYVTGMEYNPKEEGLVYARTDIGGLYRRKKDTDWVPLTDFLGSDDWGYIGIESVATDPVEPNRVYFAGGTYMNNPAALFASDDYGDTWTRYDVPFHCGGNQSGRGCGERMRVNPNNNKEVWFGSRDSGQCIYKSADGGENGYGIYRSEDKGKSWLRINDEQHLFGNLNPKYITGDSNVYGRVYFCTDGRGIVMGDVAQ